MSFSFFDKKQKVHGAKFYLATRKELFGLFDTMCAFRRTGASEARGTLSEGEDFLLQFENGTVEGNFLEIIADKKIVMIWNEYGFDAPEERNTIVQLEFSDENGMALLFLKHTGIQSKESKRNKVKFWQKFLEGLDRDLARIEQDLTF